jgi:tetratricopeptide (TPR) repeat protein
MQPMSRYMCSIRHKLIQKFNLEYYTFKEISYTCQQPRRCGYTTHPIRRMPTRTIEITALPGPEFLDIDGNYINRAKVAEIFFPSNHKVFSGDAIMALEKEGLWKNHLKRELTYVVSPVSGTIVRHLVKVKDDVTVGDPIFEIDTIEDYERASQQLPVIRPTPKVAQTRRGKFVYLPLPKETIREYKLVRNEIDSLEDEIKRLQRMKRHAEKALEAADVSVATTIVSSPPPTITDTTNALPPRLTSEMSKFLCDKIDIYNQILQLKLESYQSTEKRFITPEMEPDAVLQYQRINDSDPLEIGSTYRSMGLLYMRLQKYDDALESMKEAVSWHRRKNRQSDFQHFDLLQEVLVHFGIIKHKLLDMEGARRALYEAFKLQTRYLGHSYHPIIANTVHLMGELDYDLGKFEEALQSFEVARDVFCDIGTRLPKRLNRHVPQIASPYSEPTKSIDKLKVRYKIETAKVMHNLSLVRERLGFRHKAVDCATQELRLRKSVLPPNDISIAVCHYMIGDLLFADGGQQKKDPPINHYLSALSIYETNYGKTHKTVAMIYISIGALHLMHKKYDEAHKSYKKGIEILEVTDGYVP